MTSMSPDRLDYFIIGHDSAIHHKTQNQNVWTDYESLGGQFIYGIYFRRYSFNTETVQ